MNVAMIQPRNGYNQYYFTMDSTFFETKLTRTRPSRGQMLEVETDAIQTCRSQDRDRGQNFGLAARLSSKR